MCNNLAAIFYVFGAMPFFIFMPKYIEVIYAQSASFSNLITGTPSIKLYVRIRFENLNFKFQLYILNESKFLFTFQERLAWLLVPSVYYSVDSF